MNPNKTISYPSHRAHQSSLSEHRALLAEKEAQLAQVRYQLNQLEQRVKYADTSTRRQRTHHLVTRGAAVESVMPDLCILTEAAFYSLMESIFALPEVSALAKSALTAHTETERL